MKASMEELEALQNSFKFFNQKKALVCLQAKNDLFFVPKLPPRLRGLLSPTSQQSPDTFQLLSPSSEVLGVSGQVLLCEGIARREVRDR